MPGLSNIRPDQRSFEVIDFLLNRLRQEGFAGYPLDARIKEKLTERGAWVG